MNDQPGVVEAIPTSRVISFRADADNVVALLKPYGQLMLAFTATGPHTLRVDPARDFATTVAEVQAILHLVAKHTRR
jgi:hypothetical protein